MQLQPPHLPKKQETLAISQTTKQTFFYFVSCVLLSLFTSLATLAVSLSFLIPRAVPEVRFYTVEHASTQNISSSVDSSVIDRIADRQVSLFDKRKQKQGWNTLESKITTGYILTSDGWVIFPLTDSNFDKKNFEAVDSRGSVYSLETVFVDPKFSLVYAKVSGDGLRFVSFPNWKDIQTSTALIAVLESEYVPTGFSGIKKNLGLLSTETELWKPQYLSRFSVSGEKSIFTKNGDFVGLTTESMFVPGWYIENGLESILTNKILTYSGLSWKGEFVESGKQNGFVRSVHGFYLTQDTPEGFKAGDLITKINGEEFTSEIAPRLLLKAPKTVSIQYIREGKTEEKQVEKQALRPF